MAKPSALATGLMLGLGLAGAPLTAFAAAEPAAKSDDYYTKKVCESVKVTGSRLGATRRCRTQAELDAVKNDSRRTVDRVQHMKTWNCVPPHPC
jgi:hypothetical protein